ncbi:MAG: GreA/GreB family elongation factor [Gammaproteobacteria bacterium]
MNDRNIYITQRDLDRLDELIAVARRADTLDLEYLDRLEDALLTKDGVDPRTVPPDVITMNSRARLADPLTGLAQEYTLVFPADADAAAGRISVLAPLGTAMLGATVGQTVEWVSGGNTRKLLVDAILYQPEAAGDFHL